MRSHPDVILHAAGCRRRAAGLSSLRSERPLGCSVTGGGRGPGPAGAFPARGACRLSPVACSLNVEPELLRTASWRELSPASPRDAAGTSRRWHCGRPSRPLWRASSSISTSASPDGHGHLAMAPDGSALSATLHSETKRSWSRAQHPRQRRARGQHSAAMGGTRGSPRPGSGAVTELRRAPAYPVRTEQQAVPGRPAADQAISGSSAAARGALIGAAVQAEHAVLVQGPSGRSVFCALNRLKPAPTDVKTGDRVGGSLDDIVRPGTGDGDGRPGRAAEAGGAIGRRQGATCRNRSKRLMATALSCRRDRRRSLLGPAARGEDAAATVTCRVRKRRCARGRRSSCCVEPLPSPAGGEQPS